MKLGGQPSPSLVFILFEIKHRQISACLLVAMACLLAPPVSITSTKLFGIASAAQTPPSQR